MTKLYDNYRVDGFNLLILAASIDLAILQEIQTLYLGIKKSGTSEQKNAAIDQQGSIISYADTYAGYLLTCWQRVIVTRKSQMILQIKDLNPIMYDLQSTDSNSVVWTSSSKNGEDEGAILDQLYPIGMRYLDTYYFPYVLNSYSNTKGKPNIIYDHWLGLKTNPLGQVENWPPTNEGITLSQSAVSLMSAASGGISTLQVGDVLVSTNSEFVLSIQTDGNLSLAHIATGEILWQTSIGCVANPGTAKTQLNNGALELLDGNGNSVFSTNTTGDNYVMITDSGFLNVRSMSDQSLQWTTNQGYLPSAIGLTGNPSVAVCNNEICMSFKVLNSQLMQIIASTDGISWPIDSKGKNLPARMTTELPTGAASAQGGFITLYKGVGTSHIFLNSSNPFNSSYGGLDEVNASQVTTSLSPACVGDPVFTAFFKGCNDDQGIYYNTYSDFDDGPVMLPSAIST